MTAPPARRERFTFRIRSPGFERVAARPPQPADGANSATQGSSQRITRLIGELCTRSDDFRIRWAAHDVRIHSTGVKKLHHPLVGDLDLPYESLPLELGAITSLVTYLPEPGSLSQDSLALLASWTVSESERRIDLTAEKPLG
jgi:hypothetical protein